MKSSPASHSDVYGAQLFAIHRRETIYEVIERDDGFIDVADGYFAYFSDARDWPAIERDAMAYVRGAVLDVGTGAGRHALFLQRHGLRVTAIDNSPLAVRVARARGVNDARVLAFERAARLAPAQFDTVLMLGNNFGLFGTPARLPRLLRMLDCITTSEARIIAQTVDHSKITDPAHRAYYARNRARGRLPGQLRVRVRFRNLKSPWFDYLFVSPAELCTLLRGTGWRVRRLLKDHTPQYIAIIERHTTP